MNSYFAYTCEVDSASPMIATVDILTLLITLLREDYLDNESPDWAAVQDMLYIGGMYEEAHDKMEQITGMEPDTIRFFTVPNADTGEFDLAAVAEMPDGRRFILSGNPDFMETFAKHDHYIVML